MSDTEEFAALHLEEHQMPDLVRMQFTPFDFVKNDAHADTIASIPQLVKESRQAARELPINHRGIKVGAALIAYVADPVRPQRLVIVAGNYKDSIREEDKGPEDVDSISKVCAEMEALLRAEATMCDWAGALVVASTSNRREIAKINTFNASFLQCCFDCDTVIGRSPLTNKYTPIITTGYARETEKYQVQSYGRLTKKYQKFHKTGEYEEPKVRDFYQTEWQYKSERYLRESRQLKLRRSILDSSQKDIMARHKLAMRIIGESREL